MPTRTYTNKDLNKPLTSARGERVYTNADLLIEDDFQPDDFKAEPVVEDDFTPDEEPIITTPVSANEPNSFNEGFWNSITSGEALDAGLKGAKGFAKGAILDIPESIAGMLGSAYNLVTDPVNTIKSIPSGISEAARSMLELTSQSGARPEEFGRMIGQLTGQPLATAGIVKAAPPITRGLGRIVEPVGRVMRKHQPLTGMPIISPLAGRNLQKLERVTGKGIEKLGQKMKGKPKTITAIDDKVVGPVDIPLTEGQSLSKDVDVSFRRPILEEGADIAPKTKPKVRLNPDGTYTDLGTGEVFDSTGKPMAVPSKSVPFDEFGPLETPEGAPTFNLDRNSPLFSKNVGQYIDEAIEQFGSPEQALKKAQELSQDTSINFLAQQYWKRIASELEKSNKLKPLDKRPMRERIKEIEGLPESPTLQEGKSILPKDRTIDNAPPNQRAKIMRGMNDPVDVLFSDANSRDIFGAGQRISMGRDSANYSRGLARFKQASERIAKEHNLSIEQARKAVHDYNSHIRELSKGQPKYSDTELHFKAPSFNEFLKSKIEN